MLDKLGLPSWSIMISRTDDYPAFVTYPGLPRRIRKVGAPIGVIIGLGTVTGLIVIGVTAVTPVGTGIGFALSSVAMTIVVLAYLWLDRWEPEPSRLLVFAFLWGASVAVVSSTSLQLTIEAVINPGQPDAVSPWSVVLGAPLTEEAAKGLFLLLMMTGRRRNELNSLTDCLVYAGLVGAGFAWREDIRYIASGQTLGTSLVTAALRLIMAPFAHSLFTTMFGMGVYFALQQRKSLAKVGCILLGYLGAVVMHGLWNGSSLLGVAGDFAVVVVWGGRPAGKGVKNFAAQVVELAFVRDRIDGGLGDQRAFALQQEEVDGVAAARATTPMLQALAGYRAPNAPRSR